MDPLISIVAFLLVLTILVFFHELGHFSVARWCRVKVETFSVGFGPELLGYTDRRGTRWRFGAVPLGGYVKMYGDSNTVSANAIGGDRSFTEDEKAFAFEAKTVWQRVAIITAGPLANFVLAIVLMTGLFWTYGQIQAPAKVGEVIEGTPAAQAGLKAGDLILQIDGQAIEDFGDLQQVIQSGTAGPLLFVVDRSGDRLQVSLSPSLVRETGPDGHETASYRIGIRSQGYTIKEHSLVSAFVQSLRETWSVTTGSFAAIGQMFEGIRPVTELGGPIRIAKMSGEALQLGGSSLIWLMALLSISLGILNLMPVPVLDGGHLLFCAIEAVKGSPLSKKTQEYCFRIGFALVLSLMVFVTLNDASFLIS